MHYTSSDNALVEEILVILIPQNHLTIKSFVRNCDSLQDGHFQIEIYSSTTGPWRLSGGTFAAPNDTNFKGGVFWKGAIQWISPSGSCLYFDTDEEKLGEMPMPPIPEGWDERRYRYFGESGHHLHLIEIYGPCTAVFNVYEMKGDYTKWFVKYHVDLRNIAASFPEMIRTYLDPEDLHYYVYSILCIVREENEEDSYLLLHLRKKAVRYNLKDETFEKLHDFAPPANQAEDESALQFRWLMLFNIPRVLLVSAVSAGTFVPVSVSVSLSVSGLEFNMYVNRFTKPID